MTSIYLKNLLQSNLKEVDRLKVVERGHFYLKNVSEFHSQLDNDENVYTVVVEGGYRHLYVYFKTFEQADAFCDYLASILAHDADESITVDILEHGAI